MRCSHAIVIPALLLSACSRHDAPAAEAETIDVTTDEGTMLAVDLSADGRFIVTDLWGQLWLIPVAGGNATALTNAVADTAEDQDPAFSPDGTRVVFRGERRGRQGIWMVDLDSREVTLLYGAPEDDAPAREPSWSPDGKQIAFARTTATSASGDRASRIALIDVATREVQDIVVANLPSANLRMPTWTPDGQSIVFVERVGEAWLSDPAGRMWLVPVDGGEAVPMSDDAARVIVPSVSPDGKGIAFLAPDSTQRPQVWIASLEAGAARNPRIVARHHDVAATRVRWAPDGRSLWYSADGRIQRLDLNRGQATAVPFAARLVFDRPRPNLPPVHFGEPGERLPARGFAGLALAPDGKQFAILSLGRLWIVPIGGEPRAVADVPHTARYLSWSPDASEVAWSAGSPSQHVFATLIASGVTRQLTNLPGRALYPAYSPDGKWLAFTHESSTTALRVIPAHTATISDTASTHNLGPALTQWHGSNEWFQPLWNRTSDALLRVRPDAPSGESEFELAYLSGVRRVVTLADWPDWGIHYTRAGQTLVWTRHDRLWSAPFDTSLGTPVPLGTSPAMYPSGAPDGSVLFMSDDGLRFRSAQGVEQSLGYPIQYVVPMPAPLLVRNVHIVSGTGDEATPLKDVFIDAGRIRRIADAGSLATTGRSVDAAGRYMLPGLMDLHAHDYVPELLPTFLYFGVTLVRDQGAGSMAHLASWADATSSGTIDGPRVSLGGFQYHSDIVYDTDVDRGIQLAADGQHLARVVAVAAMFGADHIKTRGFRRWDINARLVAEAHRRGLRVTGHCAYPLPVIAAGIDAKEHVGICASRGMVGMYSDLRQYADVNRLLRAAGVALVPTITYFQFAADLTRSSALLETDTALAPFLPQDGSLDWMLDLSGEDRGRHERAAADARETAAKLAKEGVTVGVGSDIWQIATGPHMEMEQLVRAGLSNAEAIRAATLGAAAIVGAEADLGSIEVGKLADLVIVDSNPLDDIRNTRRIWLVVKGGKVIERAAILAGQKARH